MKKITKRNFRILKDWNIKKIKSSEYSGFVSFGRNKSAIIYDWQPEETKPIDFDLHEYLHCAFKEILGIDRRKSKEIRNMEENLIQDICKIFRDEYDRRIGK